MKNFDIGRIIVTDGRKIFGFAIEASYEKGVLRQLGELVEKYGVMVRCIQISMPRPTDKTAKAVVFLDFLQSKLSPEEAEKFSKTKNLLNQLSS